MSKRPVMTKYRAIFIIALFVGAICEGTAFYINNASSSAPTNPVALPTPAPGATGPIVTPTPVVTASPAPAMFVVSNLTVIPFQVGEGDPVNVSVSVTNIGDLSGSLSLNLTINGTAGEAKPSPFQATRLGLFNSIQPRSGRYLCSCCR